jgi:glycerophosphoryl diester phosphodiesterase
MIPVGARHPAFQRPHVLAHRMMVLGYPENTLISLREAIQLGVDWVEFDVKVLQDGTMVSMHDTLVDRTTDGTGDITKMTYAEVRKLNAGKGYSFGFVPVPTVEEICQELAKSPRIIRAEMHIHNLYEPEPLVDLLKKYNVQDRCYFNLNAIIVAEYMREEMHDSHSLLSLNVSGPSPELGELCKKFDLSYLCVSVTGLNKTFVNEIHNYRPEHPLFVHSYPVQTEQGWKSLLEIGVDVIQTDYPEALIEYLTNQ